MESEESKGAKKVASVRGIVRIKYADNVDDYVESVRGGEGPMCDQLRNILGEVKTRLQELYGDRLVDLILYGSQARGDAVEGSDIDVLVVLKGEVNAGKEIDRSGGVIAGISLEHSVVVSCVFMDEDRFIHRNGPLLRNVRREGIRL